ncbi:FtsX-like permease family protein [compost metagenome]
MFLALREIRHSKARYTLIAVIMLLISFLVLFVTGLAQGLSYANISALANMKATGFIVQKDADHRFRSSQLSEAQLDAARAAVGSQNADYLGVQSAAVTVPGADSKLDITFFAVDMQGSLAPPITEGQALTNDTVGSVVADSKLKDSGVTLGGTLTDPESGLSWTVAGFTKDRSYSHAPVVYMNQGDWLKLKGASGKASSGLTFNAIAVNASGEQSDKLAGAVDGAELITKKQAISAVPGYSAEQGSLLMMIVFLYVISAFVLSVFFYVITIQKTGQFGILKATGARSGYLAWSVMAQVLALSLVSLAVSLLLTGTASRMMPSGMPFHMDVRTMLMTGGLFIGVSLVGSLVSVFRVTKIDALEAIGRTGA